jgi:translation initiation factor IF-3
MTRQEALNAARDAELDLVEVSPDANPPVCKIVDYGKYNYQREKQAQKNKRNVKVQEVKQMRFGLKIGDNDMAVKLRKVQSFLDNGDKVKIAVVYRGRENAHRELGFTLANKIIDSFNGTIAVDSEPQLNGKQLIFMIRGTGAKPVVKQDAPEQPSTTFSV